MKTLRILLMIAAIALFLAVIPIWAYGYYTFLRIIVFIAAIYAIVKSSKIEVLKNHKVPLIIIAIIFNPSIPIYLYNRLLWMPIDLVGGIYLLALSRKLK